MDVQFMRVKDIRRTLGISNGSAYRLARKIRHVQEGSMLLVYRDSFQEWLRSHTVDPQNSSPPGGPSQGD